MCKQLAFDTPIELKMYDIIRSILEQHPDYIGNLLEFKKNQLFYSLNVSSFLICRIIVQKQGNFISFPKKYSDLLPQEFEVKYLKSDEGFFRIQIKDIEHINQLKNIFLTSYSDALISIAGDSFDCCHLYMECSNQKKCIHNDEVHSLACTYRQKLKQGIIFFGENRNLD